MIIGHSPRPDDIHSIEFRQEDEVKARTISVLKISHYSISCQHCTSSFFSWINSTRHSSYKSFLDVVNRFFSQFFFHFFQIFLHGAIFVATIALWSRDERLFSPDLVFSGKFESPCPCTLRSPDFLNFSPIFFLNSKTSFFTPSQCGAAGRA